MILDNNVDIKINAANFKHYSQYFEKIKCGNTVTVSIDKLNIGTDTKVHVMCDVCGDKKYLSYKMYLKNISKYNKYSCSRKCCQFKTEQTCIKKYGVNNPSKSEIIKNRIKETNNIRYGVDYTFQSEEIKNKIKITNIDRYGVEYPQQNKHILQKSNETNLIKYGFKRSSENNEVKEKIHNKLKNYWENKLLNEYSIISISGNIYELMCECGNHTYKIEKSLLNNRKYFKTKTCTICNKKYSGSGYQKKLFEYISEIYNGEIIINYRKILDNEFEIDIYLPKLKIGIEYNGLYWHSDNFLCNNYHYDKYLKCLNKGVLLIQIWEDEWVSNREYINNYLKNIISKKEYHTGTIIKMNNMKPYILHNYKLSETIEPTKFYVNNKIRYKHEIDKYDFVVYDAGYSIYKKQFI